jgi:hypothetical protein
MQLINRQSVIQTGFWLVLCLFSLNLPLMALESDRQQPLEVNANSTDGTLGDGITTLLFARAPCTSWPTRPKSVKLTDG